MLHKLSVPLTVQSFVEHLDQYKGIWGRWYREEPHGLYKDTALVTYTHIKGLQWAGQVVSTVELHISGLIGTASHPDMQKIRIIGFLFENRLHWQSEVWLLLFAVCTCVRNFRPHLICSSTSHTTVLYLIRQPVISR